METTNHQLDLERRMVGDIYTSHTVMDTLAVLCDDIGPRLRYFCPEVVHTRMKGYQE